MFKTLNNDPHAMQKGRHTVFIVSDATAITADTLAHSVLTQFSDFEYDQHRIPFVDTVEKAQAVAKRINEVHQATGVRPVIFSTFINQEVDKTFTQECTGFRIDLFRSFIKELEQEIGMKSAHSMGRSHVIADQERYNRRIEAINYTLAHDDGQMNKGLNEADVILVGVSRSGKTPTSLYLAMQFGIKAANYPLIPEDFDRGELPEVLQTMRHKLFGLSIAPERLSQIRNERRPGSRYASLTNCTQEILAAENMMRREGIKWLSSTTRSIEEISATILAELKLNNAEMI